MASAALARLKHLGKRRVCDRLGSTGCEILGDAEAGRHAVMSSDETVLGGGRYATDAAGYRSMLTYAKQWPERRWAIEGSNGAGRHIAIRLVADGETVVDVARAENVVHGSDQRGCSSRGPAVMITDYVPAVRVPPDHAGRGGAAPVPA